MNTYDVFVVGGGAAGLMAAGAALERGLSVCLFDKNRQLGRKVRITGKGRCNVTNNCPAEEVVAACPRGGKFLYGALSAFSPQDTMAFFEGLGVPEAVTAVLVEKGRAVGVRTAAGTYRGGSVILCCGGASYPGTGSNGDGYKLAAAVGHTIVTPTPSLVPLVERGPWCRRLMGLSLRNCGVKVTQRGKKKPVYEDFGELLFTHFGLSGPTILSASAHLHPMEPGKYTVHIDLKPALSEQQLDARLLRELEAHKNKIFANSLEELLPQKLIPVAVERSGIPRGDPVPLGHQGAAPGLAGAAQGLPRGGGGLPALGGGHRHQRRGEPAGDFPQDHGVQAGGGLVRGRGAAGRRRLHRRLQFADSLCHR